MSKLLFLALSIMLLTASCSQAQKQNKAQKEPTVVYEVVGSPNITKWRQSGDFTGFEDSSGIQHTYIINGDTIVLSVKYPSTKWQMRVYPKKPKQKDSQKKDVVNDSQVLNVPPFTGPFQFFDKNAGGPEYKKTLEIINPTKGQTAIGNIILDTSILSRLLVKPEPNFYKLRIWQPFGEASLQDSLVIKGDTVKIFRFAMEELYRANQRYMHLDSLIKNYN